MAEAPTTETTPAPEATAPEPTPAPTPAVPSAPALTAAELETYKSAVAELKALKDAQLSEQERAQQAAKDAADRAAAAEAELADLRAAQTRAKVATEHGLPAALADRLKGATAEELAADAKALADLLKGAATPNLRTRPTPTVPTGGAVDNGTTGDIDPMKLAATVLARRLG
ncbi:MULTISPECIES: DUF4355 domain-containing protein [unclassified Kitasatospora]|uniref:capsid assembly scaffolding protein Gp46 family protein n=1 Tax=unclassified Kitasatospora TaxID=2633591 RepID=UPI00068B8223|nr:DUF4355 domain-containing protein [Kitasatospora sp. MBT66]